MIHEGRVKRIPGQVIKRKKICCVLCMHTRIQNVCVCDCVCTCTCTCVRVCACVYEWMVRMRCWHVVWCSKMRVIVIKATKHTMWTLLGSSSDTPSFNPFDVSYSTAVHVFLCFCQSNRACKCVIKQPCYSSLNVTVPKNLPVEETVAKKSSYKIRKQGWSLHLQIF